MEIHDLIRNFSAAYPAANENQGKSLEWYLFSAAYPAAN